MYLGPRIVDQELSSRFLISFAAHEIPPISTYFHGSVPNRDTHASSTTELAAIVSNLIQSSLQPSSIPTYKRAWKLFYQFIDNVLPGTPATIPISPANLALFIAYLYKKQYACSTVNTYVSALGYSHKLSGFVDPTKSVFLSSKC